MLMKRNILILIIFLNSIRLVYPGVETNKLLKELDEHIENRHIYIQQKQAKITILKESLKSAKNKDDRSAMFDLYDQLYNEYKSFAYDSAFKYVNQLNKLAPLLNDHNKIIQAKIKIGFTLLSSGLFKESLDTLLSIKLHECSSSIHKDFYIVIARTYYDLADYNNDSYFSRIYIKKGNTYLDSAIQLMEPDTPEYWSAIGLQKMKYNEFEGSADAFNFLISKYKISNHEYAIATSSLGYLYTILNREKEAVDMLIKAAIADIQSSTKETVALRNLAVLLFNQGDINRAYRYIKIALEDATFYNARHRKVEIGAVLPIIEGERLRTVEIQKKKIGNYALVVSILSILVFIFFIIIYLQLKKLKVVRKILQETNNNLQEINQKLMEANIIKEEYIGYFFNINSEFIEKLENFQKTILRKIIARQFDDLADIIKSSDLRKERENLYANFDKIFLKLFPRFVDEFNSFFKEEDRIILKKDELLNTDLRIFALMRLGITDSEKIAKFLDFSVNTIYTYKTKIKNKVIANREEFEEKIMEIKAF